jgi:hypothetical protein
MCSHTMTLSAFYRENFGTPNRRLEFYALARNQYVSLCGSKSCLSFCVLLENPWRQGRLGWPRPTGVKFLLAGTVSMSLLASLAGYKCSKDVLSPYLIYRCCNSYVPKFWLMTFFITVYFLVWIMSCLSVQWFCVYQMNASWGVCICTP